MECLTQWLLWTDSLELFLSTTSNVSPANARKLFPTSKVFQFPSPAIFIHVKHEKLREGLQLTRVVREKWTGKWSLTRFRLAVNKWYWWCSASDCGDGTEAPTVCTAPIKVGYYPARPKLLFNTFRCLLAFWKGFRLQWDHGSINLDALLQYSFANFSTPDYNTTGVGSLHLRLINQRSDFSFAFFIGNLTNVSTERPSCSSQSALCQIY